MAFKTSHTKDQMSSGSDIVKSVKRNSVKLVPTKEQEDIIFSVTNGEDLVIDAKAGSAKAQPLWSVVKTPYGDRMIGDLKVGDEIFRKDGSVGKVTGVFPQGMKATYHVTFRDGTSTHCNEEHLWTVANIASKKKNSWKTITLATMLDKCIKRTTPCGETVYHYKIPLCSPVQYSTKELPIHPYVLGLLLGDGYLHGSTPCISFGMKDIEARTVFEDFLDPEFVTNCRFTSENGQQCTIYNKDRVKGAGSNHFKAKLEGLGLLVKGVDKFIPDVYLQGDIVQRLWLLRGLMDSDGSISNNRVGFSNCSPRLIQGVKSLVQSLGGTVIETKKRTKDSQRHNTVFNLNVKMFENPFYIQSKASLWKFSSKTPPSRYIHNVELVGYDEQVCISVDSEDSLYLTDNFIVTHNTSSLVMIANALHKKGKSGLYLAFNKAIADDAKGKFPASVDCRTIHSLAYSHLSKGMKAKLSLNNLFANQYAERYKFKAEFVHEVGNVDEAKFVSISGVWSMVRNTVENFCKSSDVKLSKHHVAKLEWMYIKKLLVALENDNNLYSNVVDNQFKQCLNTNISNYQEI